MIQFNLLCASSLLFLTLNERVCCVFQLLQKDDGKGMILQWCKASVLQVFIITNISDVLTTCGKMVSFFLENTDLLGLCYLINQFAEVECFDELRSRKLWYLPVAAGGPGSAFGICVCAVLLWPLGQLCLVGGCSQEPEQTRVGGSWCWEHVLWVTAGKYWEIYGVFKEEKTVSFLS